MASPNSPVADARLAFDPQAWLAAIVSSSDDAVVGKRLDGTIVSWNAAAARLFGYDAEEIVGRSVMALVPADRYDEERSILERLARGERVEPFETIRLRKGGTRLDVSISVSPIRDERGKIVGAAKIARDVGLQRRLVAEAQDARAAAERAAERISQLQSLTAALAGARTPADVAAVMATEGLRSTGADAGALAARGSTLTPGGSRDEVVIVQHAGLDPAVATSWSRFPLSTRSASATCIRTGEPLWLESREALAERLPDVRDAIVAQGVGALATIPLVVDGEAIGSMTYTWREPRAIAPEEREFFLGLARQASQALERVRLAESERRARTAAERLQSLTATLSAAATRAAVGEVVMHEGVAALGAYAGVLAMLVGDGAELELLDSIGYPAEACMSAGRRWPASAEIPMAEAVRRGEPVFIASPAEWGERYLGGYAPRASRSQAWAAIPIVIDGRPWGVLLWSYDAPHDFADDERGLMTAVARQCAQALERTQLYEAERAARSAAEVEAARAEEASRAKSDFLATMSHELRTPLNAVAGYVELIQLGIAGPVTERQQEYLARLRASSTHLLGLIDDVLDLSKIDAGQFSIADEVGTASAAVQAASTIALPQAQARQLTLVTDEAVAADVAYLGDPDRVRQILVNLLSNAVKFTEPGGRIVVRAGDAAEAAPAARVTGAGPWSFIAVQDTGIGIAPELQAAVFDPFVQAETGKTRTRGGTGLGLAISRRLARLMGGDLTLESAPGSGSTFTLWLPAAAGAAAPGETRPPRGAPAAGSAPRQARGLAPLGSALRGELDAVVEAWDARLRAEPGFATLRRRGSAQVEDHTLAFVADVVQSLVIVDQTGGLESELLAHGSDIQRIIGERHGAQRLHLGFTELQVAREYEILADVLTSRVERIAGADSEDRTLAAGVLTRLVMHARAAALQGYRAAADAARGNG